MKSYLPLAATILFLSSGLGVGAQEDANRFETIELQARNWVEERIQPSLHLNYAVGDSSGKPQELALGHHDPTREEGTIQGLELGASLRANDYLHGFATYTLHYGAGKEWAGEWEEYFLKLRALDLAELRGGRMLSRFGEFNAHHLHAWEQVDMPLVIGRFLGDDGLILDGGDASLFLALQDTLTLGLIAGYGNRPAHAHEHAHTEESEEHDHVEEGEEHAHDPAEEALAQDQIFTARVFTRYTPTDFQSCTLGLSGLAGETEEGLDSSVLGLDFSYTWRENGYETGGRSLRWVTEYLIRSFDSEGAHHAEDHTALQSLDEQGFYSSLTYAFNAYVSSGLRVGWVEGIPEIDLEERVRISPNLTYWIDAAHRYQTRLQYNYDELDSNQEEHSVWLQLALSLGGPEVR